MVLIRPVMPVITPVYSVQLPIPVLLVTQPITGFSIQILPFVTALLAITKTLIPRSAFNVRFLV